MQQRDLALNGSLATLKKDYKYKLQSHSESMNYLEDAVSKLFHETALNFAAASLSMSSFVAITKENNSVT